MRNTRNTMSLRKRVGSYRGYLIAALLVFSVGSKAVLPEQSSPRFRRFQSGCGKCFSRDAENQLQRAEYRQGYSDTIKKGDVISVEPGVGSKVDKGSTVIVISERSREG